MTPVTAAQPTVTPYMNSAALNEIAGELLITVRELREELLQVRTETVVLASCNNILIF